MRRAAGKFRKLRCIPAQVVSRAADRMRKAARKFCPGVHLVIQKVLDASGGLGRQVGQCILGLVLSLLRSLGNLPKSFVCMVGYAPARAICGAELLDEGKFPVCCWVSMASSIERGTMRTVISSSKYRCAVVGAGLGLVRADPVRGTQPERPLLLPTHRQCEPT